MRERPPYLIWPLDGIKLLLTFAVLFLVLISILTQGTPSAQPRPISTVAASPTRQVIVAPTTAPTVTRPPATATRPAAPTTAPTKTLQPTLAPTEPPTTVPTATPVPTQAPTLAPTAAPTAQQTPAAGTFAVTLPEPGATLRTTRPIFVGIGRAGDVVTVLDDQRILGTATVDARGRWRFVTPEDLAAGEHTINFQLRNSQGELQAETLSLKIVIAP